ncbi:MAG: iron uptake porin [Cyanobacteria bacterium]|nr:iron uptake porin [Cyanobacteriota bacterium]
MKLFQQLLVAPAALGLLAPMAVSASELNLTGVNQYASSDQVTSVTQFSDVKPNPNGTFKGGQALTRWEAAALLNACLDRITEVTDELKKLMAEFEKELAVLRGRVDGLEAKVGELEANQFSTTTKLKGIATFVLGANSFGGGNRDLSNFASNKEGATSFNYDVRLNFDTSFTGKDLLRTTLRAGNFGDSAFGNGYGYDSDGRPVQGLNSLEVAFQENCGTGVDCGDVVAINRLFYQFPIGSGFTATIGGKVRQDDMLAMWPSAYPADTILDIFTYAGAPGAYNLNLGAGAGLWWKSGNWSISANYVAENGDGGSPDQASCLDKNGNVTGRSCGGIGTEASRETGTVQLGYAGSNWGLAAAYNYSNGIGVASGTPLSIAPQAAAPDGSGVGFSSINSVGISGYWQPKNSGWFPSISTGWGLNSYNGNDDAFNFDGPTSQSWYVGLQWADAFIKGNSLGMAVGQPTFVTGCGDVCNNYDGDRNTTPHDGNYAWEWWYKFQVTDNISVTPAIYYLSNPLGQAGYVDNQRTGDSGAALTNFGGLIKTTFKF